ncbi:MAG: hypothetical protein AB7E51_13760, partial [Pseudodesulfovibrio sp.]|uniref:hypothetical protein n=1 Tax=Pseudodesulfovibrio sp. TaxID=2035812 RepID=UPI003D144790
IFETVLQNKKQRYRGNYRAQRREFSRAALERETFWKRFPSPLPPDPHPLSPPKLFGSLREVGADRETTALFTPCFNTPPLHNSLASALPGGVGNRPGGFAPGG